MGSSEEISDLEKEFLDRFLKVIRPKEEVDKLNVDTVLCALFTLFLMNYYNISDEFKTKINSEIEKDSILRLDEIISIYRFSTTFSGPNDDLQNKIMQFFKGNEGVKSVKLDLRALRNSFNSFSFSLDENDYRSLITPRLLSIVVENDQVTSTTKKKSGQYYTRPEDANLISSIALYRYLSQVWTILSKDELFELVFRDKTSKNLKSPSDNGFSLDLCILDPACGSGTFLVEFSRLYEKLCNKLGKSSSLVVYGTEVDSSALLATQLRFFLLEMFWISRKKQRWIELNVKLTQEDFLLAKNDQKYDIIIGNPPYVRHEDIGLNLSNDYKTQISKDMQFLVGNSIKFDRKSDLYIYFSIKCLSLLNNDYAVLSLLTSNAWLEVKYGKILQQYLIQNLVEGNLSKIEIIHQAGIRFWKQIGINSIIFLATKNVDKKTPDDYIYFTEASKKLTDISRGILKEGISFCNEFTCDEYRTEKIPLNELTRTHKWAGNFLRTSRKERSILEKIKHQGQPLSKLAIIKFGVKTGANAFFHVYSSEPLKEKSVVSISNSENYVGKCETKYLTPMIKSPTEIKGFVIYEDFEPNLWLFNCSKALSDIRDSHAHHYIKWGEKATISIKQGKAMGSTVKGFSSLESVKGDPWYVLPKYETPNLLWTKSYHDKPGCLLNLANCVPDQRFYSIYVNNPADIKLIFTYLNSSYVWALMEQAGNTNMGFGVLDTNVYWLKSVYIPKIEGMDQLQQLESLFEYLLKEKARNPITQNNSIQDQIDQFFSKILGLSKEELTIVRKYNQTSVENRLTKGN
jgi:type I restriction-modification system DNA methylase subunit